MYMYSTCICATTHTLYKHILKLLMLECSPVRATLAERVVFLRVAISTTGSGGRLRVRNSWEVLGDSKTPLLTRISTTWVLFGVSCAKLNDVPIIRSETRILSL